MAWSDVSEACTARSNGHPSLSTRGSGTRAQCPIHSSPSNSSIGERLLRSCFVTKGSPTPRVAHVTSTDGRAASTISSRLFEADGERTVRGRERLTALLSRAYWMSPAPTLRAQRPALYATSTINKSRGTDDRSNCNTCGGLDGHSESETAIPRCVEARARDNAQSRRRVPGGAIGVQTAPAVQPRAPARVDVRDRGVSDSRGAQE